MRLGHRDVVMGIETVGIVWAEIREGRIGVLPVLLGDSNAHGCHDHLGELLTENRVVGTEGTIADTGNDTRRGGKRQDGFAVRRRGNVTELKGEGGRKQVISGYGARHISAIDNFGSHIRTVIAARPTTAGKSGTR